MTNNIKLSLSVKETASVLTALDLAIEHCRRLDNIVTFQQAKAVILNQIGIR